MKWIAAHKAKIASGGLLLGLIAGVAWVFLYEALPGGLWHRNRLTGATCYKTVYCWATIRDPFGKGLKLPKDPFGAVE